VSQEIKRQLKEFRPIMHTFNRRKKKLAITIIIIIIIITPSSTALLEKLPGSQLVKKFPAFYGNRRFITAYTWAQHLSLP
jgi:hypothetical protein